MLKTLKLSRRFALRGALSGIGVAMWLPVLEAMCNESGTAFAAGTPLPTSFGIFYWGNGVHFKYWTPAATGNGNSWALPTSLQSFAPVKEYMTMVTGLNMLDGQFKGHGAGVLYVLAGGDATNATLTSQLGRGRFPSSWTSRPRGSRRSISSSLTPSGPARPSSRSKRASCHTPA